MDCRKMESISIPSGVTSIGSAAFERSNLASVTIPSGVTTLKSWTFAYNYNLKSVVIPKSVTQIEYYAFFHCYSTMVIYGYTDSEAERYAKSNGFTFVALDEERGPTVSNFRLNDCEQEVIVKNRDILSFGGTVSAPAGLKVVQASIFLESDPNQGCKAVRKDDFAANVSTFDLSELAPIVVGQTYTDPDKKQSITMEAGKTYLVGLYATDSNRKGFESMPSIKVIVVEDTKLHGTVFDENNNGLAGVKVKVYKWDNGKPNQMVSETTTDENGYWSVSPLTEPLPVK